MLVVAFHLHHIHINLTQV